MKLPQFGYAEILLVLLLLYVSITIIVKEWPLILLSVTGTLAYFYRDKIKEKLKKYINKTDL